MKIGPLWIDRVIGIKLGPLLISPWRCWVWMRRTSNPYGIFRNHPEVKPGRWGFYWLGFEFGSRNPGNRFGIFLKRVGLWPW